MREIRRKLYVSDEDRIFTYRFGIGLLFSERERERKGRKKKKEEKRIEKKLYFAQFHGSINMNSMKE